jgi:tetratricopeptide (TPR) repeat protein
LPVDGSALSSLVDEIESTIRAAAEFEAADKSSVSTIDSDYELHSATVLRLEEWTAVVRAYVMLHPDDIEKLILQARVTYAYTSMSMVEAELARIRGGFDEGARMAEFQKPLDHALELDDDLVEVHYWKARLYTLRGPYERVPDNIDSAIRSASRAVKLDATNLLYREALASYLFCADRRTKAVATLGAVVAEDDPKYLLLTDMQQMPIPEEAVFDEQATIEQARIEAVPRELSEDYPHPMLRIATYWIAQPASEIEEFY